MLERLLVERRLLPAWLAQRLKAQGQPVPEGEDGQRALAFFADRVEGNLLAAHQELQKLALLKRALDDLQDHAHPDCRELAALSPRMLRTLDVDERHLSLIHI